MREIGARRQGEQEETASLLEVISQQGLSMEDAVWMARPLADALFDVGLAGSGAVII